MPKPIKISLFEVVLTFIMIVNIQTLLFCTCSTQGKQQLVPNMTSQHWELQIPWWQHLIFDLNYSILLIASSQIVLTPFFCCNLPWYALNVFNQVINIGLMKFKLMLCYIF
uniref:Transmembrane domain-containing protein n=1 Tax=Spironucleus salmonicida TaxID=348837 RepID=V6LP84_9EUKA|eukprot:EST43396.1 Transmembrane domain-containing protein [Spironucleus salmonicida]